MVYPQSIEQKLGFTFVRESVMMLCVTVSGRARCEAMSMLTDYDAVAEALGAAAEMLDIVNSGEAFPLDAVQDINEILNGIRAQGTFLPAGEMMRVRHTLGVMAAVSNFFARRRGDEESDSPRQPLLQHIAAGLLTFPALCAAIDRVLDRYGNVKDNASQELGDIRRRLQSMSGTVNSVLRRVMARAVQEGVLEQDAAPTMRDGRLVLPVSPMHKRKIQGIVHDESASGKTVFIEPAEVVEVNNRIRELQIEEHREIARILAALSAEIRPYIDDIMLSNDVLGHLDFIHAKALYAVETGGTMPSLSREPEIEWYHACHPGLLASLKKQGKEVVPLDITLNRHQRILIISGPNAGGKSVCLKTVGVVQYMAQCGLLPPVYENSHFGIFSDIFVDIGDDQSLEDDLSTYSSHLRNMRLFLGKGRTASLVLIDEFGGGTEPQIGGAIAQAILKQMNIKGMWGVITTHYQNLKHFAEDTEGLINGSMLYDRHLMRPLFKLSIGNPGSSFALEIARKIGLPEEILSDAEAIVGSDYVNMDKYLLDIARDKRYWENKRSAIRVKEKKIDSVLERYETEAETLREHRREILNEAKREAENIIASSNAMVERTIHDIKKAQADKERTAEARRKLEEDKKSIAGEESEHPLLKKAPRSKKRKPVLQPADSRPIAVGDVVRLDGEGTPGKVLSIEGANAVVAFGLLKTTVSLARLKHTIAKLPAGDKKGASFVSSATNDAMRDRQLKFKQDIDVRGMRVDEAVQAVTYFIDDAIQFSAQRVRILHGTGTGALRQYLRQYLSTVSGVRSFHDEDVRFGGAGITVVELE
jgi:hypothetical protein